MVTLVIMDGFGYSEKTEGNAIALQGTPNLDKLNKYSKFGKFQNECQIAHSNLSE